MRLYGITYGKRTTDFIPYHNKATDKLWRFEYNPMIDIVDNLCSDLPDSAVMGIFSWKFTQKTGYTAKMLIDRYNQYRHPKYQVYNLSPDLKLRKWNFMDWCEEGHKGMRYLIQCCCEHVGITYENNPPVVVYANQFMAEAAVYRAYMAEVIKPCLKLLEGELWPLANRPAGYTQGLPSHELRKQTGLDFYNYIPFVLERMTMQFIHHHKISTLQLL